MKTTSPSSHQPRSQSQSQLLQSQLEQQAIDAMIAYGKDSSTRPQMLKALDDALLHYGSAEGHREIVLNGWIIKTIHALDRCQLRKLERTALEHLTVLSI